MKTFDNKSWNFASENENKKSYNIFEGIENTHTQQVMAKWTRTRAFEQTERESQMNARA